MGSLPCQNRQSQENSLNDYRVYASFCPRDPAPDVNMANWIECYNPSNNSWHRTTTIPGPDDHVLKDFAMVPMGDSIYVIGGRLCHKMTGKEPGDGVVEVELEVLSSVLRYNVHTDVWSKCAPLGTARFNFACTISDNKIYVAGGQAMLDSARGISSAEVYDPGLDQWRPLPNMSTLRYKCVGVTWQGRIHVVGGFAEKEDCDSQGPYMMERSSAEVYDTRAARWDLMARMWELDVPPNQIVAVGGKLYSSGDCLNTWKGHIEAYDAKLNIWNVVEGSYLHTLSSPISTSDAMEENWDRQYLTVAPIGTHLYFLAGYRMPGEISRLKSAVHVFDTSSNGDGWRSFEPMEEEGEKELCCHCCVLKQVPNHQAYEGSALDNSCSALQLSCMASTSTNVIATMTMYGI
ncbi:hypothetical protein F0562_010875 [Nyssa sinensis]|uniref:Uncharacterized protein n=1 Tax=Nyssa sinensis TaxID=561372 RepID=A0A5J5A3R6_9ASTE|nr:hypothetical protein F0562_010875 [Nyssa sinensis]